MEFKLRNKKKVQRTFLRVKVYPLNSVLGETVLSHLHYGTTEHYFRPKMIIVMSQFINCFRAKVMFQHCCNAVGLTS